MKVAIDPYGVESNYRIINREEPYKCSLHEYNISTMYSNFKHKTKYIQNAKLAVKSCQLLGNILPYFVYFLLLS